MHRDGTVTCWGDDRYGQVSHAYQDGARPLVQLTSGTFHSCGVTAAGALRCWGRDDQSQVRGPNAAGADYTQVSAGGLQTCAARKDGRRQCWGRLATLADLPLAPIVSLHTTGGGRIQERFGNYACRGQCEDAFPPEQLDPKLVFHAIADAGRRFVEWTGDCTGSGAREITTADHPTRIEVGARFEPTGLSYDVCPGPVATPSAATGTLSLPGVVDFIPLCNGWVLYGEQTGNRLVRVNALDGSESHAFQLSSAPVDVALDRKHGIAYASYSTGQWIARADLTTGAVEDLWVGVKVNSLAVSDEGTLFIAPDGYRGVTTMDSATTTVKGFHDIVAHNVDYNDATDRLISYGSNYAYDEATDTLTKQGRSAGSGSGARCDRVYVSPDGEHAALPCGAGNGGGYSVYDFYSYDPSIVLGEWVIARGYPSGAASPRTASTCC